MRQSISLIKQSLDFHKDNQSNLYNSLAVFYEQLPDTNSNRMLSNEELFSLLEVLLQEDVQAEINVSSENGLFNSLVKKSCFNTLMPGLIILKANGLFDFDNFDRIQHLDKECYYYLVMCFNYLSNAQILGKKEFIFLVSEFRSFIPFYWNKSFEKYSDLCEKIHFLYQNNLLKEGVFACFMKQDISISVFEIIARMGISDEQIIKSLKVYYPYQHVLSEEILRAANINDEETIALLQNHNQNGSKNALTAAAYALTLLEETELPLDIEEKKLVINHDDLDTLLSILSVFINSAEFSITKDIFLHFLQPEIAKKLINAVHILADKNILTLPNFNLIRSHADPGGAATLLAALTQHHCLTPENRRIVEEHGSPRDLIRVVRIFGNKIEKYGLIYLNDLLTIFPLNPPALSTIENIDYFIENNKNKSLIRIINLFIKLEILTQENLNFIKEKKEVNSENQAILEEYFYNLIFENDSDNILSEILDDLTEYQSMCPARIAFCRKYQNFNKPEFVMSDLDILFLPLDALTTEKKINDAHFFKILTMAFNGSPFALAMVKEHTKLNSIRIYDEGSSVDQWWRLTKQIIQRTPAPSSSQTSLPVKEINELHLGNIDTLELNDLMSQWQFCKVLGRTIILKNENEALYAIKIQKDKEAADELIKQFQSDTKFKEHVTKLGLESKFPTPLAIKIVNGVIVWLKKYLKPNELAAFEQMISKKSFHFAYIYLLEEDYSIYLHSNQIPNDKFTASNRICIADLCRFLAQKIYFPQIADMYHNLTNPNQRDDQGRYIVLANLLSPAAMTAANPAGSGRLSQWKKGIQYPNVRASGLADLGDWIANDLDPSNEWVTKYFQRPLSTYGSKISNYLIAEMLASYQYVLFLIAGLRGQQQTIQTNSAQKISLIWQNLAKQIVENCAVAINILTQYSEKQATDFLHQMVDVKLMARQMQFWMTDEYISHVNNNKIPKDIYGEDVEVIVDKSKFRANTFNDKIGFSINGIDCDLGAVNGQEPIKEANKLFYWMINVIFIAYHDFTLNPAPKLTTQTPDNGMKEKRAAQTIYNFWQNHKKPKSNDNELIQNSKEQTAILTL